MAKTKQPRFIVAYSQKMDLTNETQVLIDVATGVNYMYHQNGYSGGLTVLVDGEGHPIVTPRELLPHYQG